MDDWSTIPNRNADREPAPNPTRPLNQTPPDARQPRETHSQTSASRVKRHNGANHPWPPIRRSTPPASPATTTNEVHGKPPNPFTHRENRP